MRLNYSLFNLLSMLTRLADGLGLRDVLFYTMIKMRPKFGSPASVCDYRIKLTELYYLFLSVKRNIKPGV